MNYLIYDGEQSSDFGVYIGGQGTFNAPKRSVTKYEIAGRNGELIRDNGRFENIQITYPVVIMEEFRDRSDALNAWLKSKTGYCRLEDTYNPDYYRRAMLIDEIKYKTTAWNRSGQGELTFDCMPQRFLKSGESWTSVTNGGTITNPTRFASKPIIKVSGTGLVNVKLGDYRMILTMTNEVICIDSELMDCYNDSLNANSKVQLVNGFPVINAGDNTITISGNASVQIMGRWWTI